MSGETKQRISELEAEIVRLKEAQPTLRDQFAMAALNRLIPIVPLGSTISDIADEAYAYADAMMEARDDNQN